MSCMQGEAKADVFLTVGLCSMPSWQVHPKALHGPTVARRPVRHMGR
jgi:hypothetical protein